MENLPERRTGPSCTKLTRVVRQLSCKKLARATSRTEGPAVKFPAWRTKRTSGVINSAAGRLNQIMALFNCFNKLRKQLDFEGTCPSYLPLAISCGVIVNRVRDCVRLVDAPLSESLPFLLTNGSNYPAGPRDNPLFHALRLCGGVRSLPAARAALRRRRIDLFSETMV